MSSTRSRSRSPFNPERARAPKSMLLIRNLPQHWKYDAIKNFIRENTASSKFMKFVDIIKLSGDCTVKFTSCSAAEKAQQDLDGLLVDGKEIKVTLCDAKLAPMNKKEWNKPAPSNKKEWNKKPPMRTPMNEANKPQEFHETYGLSNNYLNSLGIQPPLSNKIFVFNLSDEVNEAKIREVFGMAGHIVFIILKKHTDYVPTNERMRVTANIEFDHPVEAVQAIAMFNNQILYDKPMMMRLDHLIKGPLRKNIPGLKSIGPALGENGEPMRNVRYFLELQSLRQEIFKKFESITMNNQQINNGNQMTEPNNQLVNMQNQMANTNMQNQMMANLNPNMNVNNLNPGFIANPMITNQNMAFQPWAGMMQNQVGVIPNQVGVMPNQVNNSQMNPWKTPDNQNLMAQNLAQVQNQAMIQGNMNFQGNQDDGMNAIWSQQQQKFDKRGGGEGFDKDESMEFNDNRRDAGNEHHHESVSETLVFKYLPPSVSLSTLQQKMREIGEIKFVEMTGHGRAIVRFMSKREAEQCILIVLRPATEDVDQEIVEEIWFS